MKSYYLLLGLSITIVSTNNGMQDHTLTSVPEFVLHKILHYLSTKQLLYFRETSKQTQQVAERLLANDSSKHITINHTLFPPLAFIKKFSGITLQFDTQHNVFIDIADYLSNQISHIKALHIQLLDYVYSDERTSFKTLCTQLTQLHVLKVQQSQLSKLNATPNTWQEFRKIWNDDYCIADIIKALPLSTTLKKLHINIPVQALWVLLTQHLHTLKKLEVLHIEGSTPFNTEQFIIFTQALQNLLLLKKLCLNDIIIDENEAEALSRSLSTLQHLRILNLKKAIMLQEDFQKIKELLPALKIGKSHEPITFSLPLYLMEENNTSDN